MCTSVDFIANFWKIVRVFEFVNGTCFIRLKPLASTSTINSTEAAAVVVEQLLPHYVGGHIRNDDHSDGDPFCSWEVQKSTRAFMETVIVAFR